MGARRHLPSTPEGKARDGAKVEGTLDSIVRRALKSAEHCERGARLAVGGKDSLGAARMANAASGLYRQAIAALRARSTVGDILPKAN